MSQVLNIKEITNILNCSSSKLYAAIEKGHLKAEKVERKYQISQENLISYIEFLRLKNSEDRSNILSIENISETRSTKELSNSYENRSDRRTFMKSSLSVFGTIMMMGTGSFIGRAAYSRYEEYRKSKFKKHQGHSTINSIFHGIDDFFVSAGTNHMRKSYGNLPFHSSSNIKAATEFDNHLQSYFLNVKSSYIEYESCESISISNSDIVCFGSPVSDPISKKALEYKGVDYHLDRTKGSILDLPFEYVMNKKNNLIKQGNVKKILNNEIVKTNNWYIKNDKEIIVPKLNSDGLITKDYLLISKVPNVISLENFASGKDIWVVGGTHGVGTEAINLVLKNPEIYITINSLIKKYRYFQILHEVEVETRSFNKKNIMRPIHISNVTIKEVKLNMNNLKF